MALAKTIMTPRGTASFWILGTMWIDNFNKTAYISLYGYESREHCDMVGAVYKAKKEINIYPEDFNSFFNPSLLAQSGISGYGEGYNVVKSKLMEFADAQDLIFTGGV